MPSILPGPGNAKNHFLEKTSFRKSNTVDEVLDQISCLKAQNVQKNLLFNFLFGLNLLKNLPGKLRLLERGTSALRKTVITFF